MKSFLQKFGGGVMGVLSGFDRLVFRGTLRCIADVRGMRGFLYGARVLLKEFKEYAVGITRDLNSVSLREAEESGREVRYLPSSRTRKEGVAREIARRDRITEGTICVLKCLEPCRTFRVFSDRARTACYL